MPMHALALYPKDKADANHRANKIENTYFN